MNYWVIGGVVIFVILFTMQYSLNRIVVLLKEIKDILYKLDIKDKIK